MRRYKRVLVNLRLDLNDVNLIKYAAKIAKMADSEKIYFLFTDEQINIPDNLVEEYPQLMESAADYARDRIRESISRVLGKDTSLKTTVIIQEGIALDEILKQLRINGIDLVICGKSKENPETTYLATKLARKSSCSVLVVPESVEFSLKNPAVAIDFSEYSAHAVDAALAFAKADHVSKMQMLHVYQVPTGYYKTGKSYQEFAQIMEQHAKQSFVEFVSRFDPEGISFEENYLLSNRPVDAIKTAVGEHGITFLTLGARGRGAGAAVMLGSVSEKIIEALNIPVFAVKKKGTGLSILDIILSETRLGGESS